MFDRERLCANLNTLLYILGPSSLALLILNLGFYVGPEVASFTNFIIWWIVYIFIAQELLRWTLTPKSLEGLRQHLRTRWFQNLILLVLIGSFIEPRSIDWLQKGFPEASVEDITLAYLGLSQSLVLMAQLIASLRDSNWVARLGLTPSRLIAFSFLVPISLGTLMLKLPRATTEGLSWLDALFTATSAVCITGLVVVDTQYAFTPLGQFIIALLMQAGGLGILTLSMGFGVFFSGGLGVKERIMLSDLFSEKKMGEVGSLLWQIMGLTFTVEAIGAVAIYLSMGHSFQEFDIIAFYWAIFHSISAFCNAGFSLFSEGLTHSTTATNYLFGSSIMLLVFIGGIGFPVLSNLFGCLAARRRGWGGKIVLLTLPTKLILVTTSVILLIGILGLFLTERQQSLASLSGLDALYQSTFYVVTSRTAGFNIWPTEALAHSSAFFMMVLMWIGGSPMSTAGGIKTLTIAIAFLAIRSRITGRDHIEVFGRTIDDGSVIKAFAILSASIGVLFFSIITLSLLNPQLSTFDLAFEAVSAFGTVGLTRGITAELSEWSKMILIVLMYSGRIGFLTIVSTLFLGAQRSNYRLLTERVHIP